MLGNWSLGDYFKEDSIRWSYEFLTGNRRLALDGEKLSITVFAGDDDTPRDEESARVWRSVGIPPGRMYYLPKKDNWWGPVGDTGPCGPDTEIFYDTGKAPHGEDCRPGCPCGKYFEIWNNVFMQYNKTVDGKYVPLSQKNVDTGMGVERTVASLNGMASVYEIDSFKTIMNKVWELARMPAAIGSSQARSARIISDHVRASVFILSEGVLPGNVGRGYVLRRLLRRAIRHGKALGIEREFLGEIAGAVVESHKKNYPVLEEKREFITNETEKEERRFKSTINRGLKKFEQMAALRKIIGGRDAFLLFQSFGFPIELTSELAAEKGIEVDVAGFEAEFQRHQEASRKGAEKKFAPRAPR
jgi:alanyl-tRNA synthetase